MTLLAQKRKVFCGSEHVEDINDLFYKGVEEGLSKYLFLSDTVKAFDSIDHGWIHLVLSHLGFPTWFLRFVKGLSPTFQCSPFLAGRSIL